MSDLNEPTNEQMAPSLQLTGSSGTRYPNQFFDLSQQYMPPTIKELFRWCTFYYYNSPLIGATLKKVSRYPITDLIFEDDQDSVRDLWDKILIKEMKIKERQIEINLDLKVYGNAFISLHFPFTRFLSCKSCGHKQPLKNWNWDFRGNDFTFSGHCPKCKTHGKVDVKDVPYKDRKGIRIIRWNPENMHIKYNEYTGRYIYMYTVPPKQRNMILRGDKDVLEDTPMIVLEAISKRRMIRLNNDSIFHLKSPTLAEQDQGWGKPDIIHVLKDMFYFYTLRRAQEAIALEHIVPFDVIYPLPNAQQDPYLHTDLGSWRIQIENVIRRHRRDPNFKGVIPVPIGTARIGGDGKMLLLSPELNYLNQTIVGGLGMSQELLFGNGLNYTGSSITLRMLENDFIQNRSQLIDLVVWIKDKIRIWMTYPDIRGIRFSDFRMADDVQRNQQLIGLNAQGKISDQTMLTELGYDWDQETQKLIVEAQSKNYIMDIQTKSNARSQGEASIIQANYQKKTQDVMMSGSNSEVGGMLGQGGQQDPNQMQQDPNQMQQNPNQQGGLGELDKKIGTWAKKLLSLDETSRASTLSQLKQRMPDIAAQIEQAMLQMNTAGSQSGIGVDMSQMPENGMPRRAGAV